MKRFCVILLFLMAASFEDTRGQQVHSTTIGPCLVLKLRGNVNSGPAFEACAKATGATHNANQYMWTLPQLGYAFDQAERAQCAHLGCLGDIPVTLFVVPDALANAAVRRDQNELTLFMNTGLIDFIDASARSLRSDLVKMQKKETPTGGFGDWMMSMKRAGGQPCGFHVKFPTPQVPAENWTQEQEFATSSYQIVLAHELSHFLTAQYHCNYGGADLLALEMSCDKIAGDKLLRMSSSTFVPTPAVAWLMAMESYERLTGPLYHNLYMTKGSPATFEDMFPARDWKSRAQQLLDEWRTFCASGAQSALCPGGYEEAIGFSEDMVKTKPPSPCQDNPK